jgi:regulatory protein
VAALDMLARRDHASGELRRKLLDKGYDPAAVEALLGRLRTEHLLDDARFVENFVDLRAARGQGPLRVQAELREIGVSPELVQGAVQAYGQWLVQLRKARQKKFGASLPTDYADRQRQARFLGYRGFTGAQIRLVLGLDLDVDLDT